MTSAVRRRASEFSHSAPSPELLPVIAANVERLRAARGLSIEALAARAQLDALSLRRIETGRELPALDTLWSLANGLDVAFGELIQPSSSDTPSEVPQLPRRSLLPSARGRRQTELHEMTLAPHSEGLTPAAVSHSTESLLVTAGQLVVSYQGERRVLSVGDEVDVPANVERRYFNPGDLPTVVYAKLAPSFA
ncbi:MAG: XRE family transcriptional regulator [Polyangiales bacterium]